MSTSPRIIEFIKGLIELGVTKYQGEKFQFEARPDGSTDVGTPIGFQTPDDDDDDDDEASSP